MKDTVHHFEDKLLEFAYGELALHEANAIEAHVRGCSRCAQALDEIRSVRASMGQLPFERPPEAGLDSLLAYAEQSAKRTVEAKTSTKFRRWLFPLSSLMALTLVGVIAFRAVPQFDTNPASAVAEAKLEQKEERPAEVPPSPPPRVVAEQEDIPNQLAKAQLDDELAANYGNSGAAIGGLGTSPRASGGRGTKLEPTPSKAAAKTARKDLAGPEGTSVQEDGKQSGELAKKTAKMNQLDSTAYDTSGSVNTPPAAPSAAAPQPAEGGKGSYSLRPLGDGVSNTKMKAEAPRMETKADETREGDVSSASALQAARAAFKQGDRGTEIRLWPQVLQAGATGALRAEALFRLCEAHTALGNIERADPFCDQLLLEFPKGAEAQSVANRRNYIQRAAPVTPSSEPH